MTNVLLNFNVRKFVTVSSNKLFFISSLMHRKFRISKNNGPYKWLAALSIILKI